MLLSMLFLTLTASQPPAAGGLPSPDAAALVACDRAYQHVAIDRDAAQKALAVCNARLVPAAQDSKAAAAAGLTAGGTGIMVGGAVCVAHGTAACWGAVAVGGLLDVLGFHLAGVF